ncbi:MAG: hypothetical protein JWO44_1919 [Bacteroidetes bacterium]|nr:hypothetical protein [Bacteroidota bacterium]
MVIKKTSFFHLTFFSLLFLFGCQSNSKKEPNPATVSPKASTSLSQNDSLKSHKSIKKEDNILKTDLDFNLISKIRIRIDKNDVEWKEKEANDFRFVYKFKSKKLITYKNKKEYKIYSNPIIYFNLSKDSKIDSIKYDGENIMISDLLNFRQVRFAPSGLEGAAEYFVGNIEVHLLLNDILESEINHGNGVTN